MDRIYKTFRFAYETKYWINALVEYENERLQKQLKKGMLEKMEADLLEEYPLDGIALTVTVNATTGSIIELAVKEAETLTISQWGEIAEEVEIEKVKVNSFDESSYTPKVYLSEDTYHKLEDLQHKLKKNKRVPIMPYVIKLVVYNLYKNVLAST